MPRPRGDFEKVTIRLHTGDKDSLDRYFPNLGYNKVIRAHVRRLVTALRSRDPTSDSVKKLPEISLEDIG